MKFMRKKLFFKVFLKFLFPTFILLLLSIYFEVFLISIGLLFLLVFQFLFFRDPQRDLKTNGWVSPADGRVKSIKELKNGALKISIFMRPFDVHFNRAPCNGGIKKINHEPGKHIPAFKKESEKNEKNEVLIENEEGNICVTQIAGFFARRIYCFVDEGQCIEKGEKLGFIAFGSRVNLILPKSFELDQILIEEKEKVKAGSTKILEIK